LLLDKPSFGLASILVRKIFNPRLKARELVYVINDSDIRMVFLAPQLIEAASEIHERLSVTETYLTFGYVAPGDNTLVG
jgi:ABC-type branched-subunit amino acid transport system ATPase component